MVRHALSLASRIITLLRLRTPKEILIQETFSNFITSWRAKKQKKKRKKRKKKKKKKKTTRIYPSPIYDNDDIALIVYGFVCVIS